MSYDFYMFERPSDGGTIASPAEMFEKLDEIPLGPPDPAKEARKRKAADALLRADPGLEEFKLDFSEIPKFGNISIDEAKTRSRPLESNQHDEMTDFLRRAFPDAEVVKVEFPEIATFKNISVDQAKTRFRHLELNHRDEGLGIQVTLCDDYATLTLPYGGRSGKRTASVFARIWKYLKVIESITGYQVYDPQMDRIVDLESDLEKVTTNYTTSAEKFS